MEFWITNTVQREVVQREVAVNRLDVVHLLALASLGRVDGFVYLGLRESISLITGDSKVDIQGGYGDVNIFAEPVLTGNLKKYQIRPHDVAFLPTFYISLGHVIRQRKDNRF